MADVGDARPQRRLEVEGLVAGYGGSPIVHGLDLLVGVGEVVAVVGPNGAGKSTFLKAITGEVEVMAGSVRLDGEEVTRWKAERLARRGVGYVPQARDVFETLSVVENLQMGGYSLARSDVASHVDRVLTLFPALRPMRDRVAGRLSGGERKMLAIARTLMLDPILLVLDEPSANLAPGLGRQVLSDYVCQLAASGMAVLLVEQKVSEALRVANWAYVLVAGRARMDGPANEILARSDLADVFLGSDPTIELVPQLTDQGLPSQRDNDPL